MPNINTSSDVRKITTLIDESKINRTMQLAQARPNVQAGGPYLYALYVMDLEGEGKPARTFGFDIPPKTIRMSEPFSSDVSAGQEGGFWVDERGQYFKDLSVSGTFGFRPTPKTKPIPAGGSLGALPSRVIQSTQQLQDASSLLTSNSVSGHPELPPGEKTGYDRFRDLKNLFRFFGEKKKYREEAHRYEMVWANWKTGEVYWVQPLRFDEDRSSPSGKFQFNYSFNLRLLRPVKAEVPDDYWKNPATQLGRRDWMQKLRQAAGVLDAAKNVVDEVVNGTLDFGRDVVGAVLRPIDSAVSAIRTLVNIGHVAVDFPLEILRTAHRSSLELASVFYDAEAYADTASRWGREFRKIANAYSAAWVGLKFLAQGDVNDEAAAYQRRYQGPFVNEDDPEEAYSRTNTQNDFGQRNIPRGKKAARVPEGATIKNVAAIYLGDPSRWKEITLLNNLQYPYIDPSGNGNTVLRPGDRIFIPEEPSNAGGGIVNTSSVSANSFDFGWDLEIDPITRRFRIDPSGDLAIIGGKENLRQAMQIKIWTEPGDLVLHPWFGFSPNVGRAYDVDLVAQYNLQLKNTILSDTRISEIKYINFRSLGDELFVSVVVIPKNQDSEIALSTLRVGLATSA